MNVRHIIPLGGFDELASLRALVVGAGVAGASALLVEERRESDLDPVVVLASFAELAPSIGLGIMVSGHSGRSPSVLAKFLSGLDLVTGARAQLVIGEMGGATSESLARTVEQVGLISEMLTHDVTTLAGPNYRVDRAWNTPRATSAPLAVDKVAIMCSPTEFAKLTSEDRALAPSAVVWVDPTTWHHDASMIADTRRKIAPEFIGALVDIEGDVAVSLDFAASVADHFSAVYLRWSALPTPEDLARCSLAS